MFWGGGGEIFAFENYPQMTMVFLVLAVEVCVSLPYGCKLAVLGLAEVSGRRWIDILHLNFGEKILRDTFLLMSSGSESEENQVVMVTKGGLKFLMQLNKSDSELLGFNLNFFN